MNWRRLINGGDVAVLGLLVMLAGGISWAGFSGGIGGRALVRVDGDTVAALSLDQPSEFDAHGPLGPSQLVVEDGSIRFVDSPCPHELCVKMGRARIAGQVLICVPNRVAVLVEGGEDEAGVDGVTG